MLNKAKRVKKEIIYLTPEELKKLDRYKFTQPKLQFVKVLFIFNCYTGLPYNALMRLKDKQIQKEFEVIYGYK